MLFQIASLQFTLNLFLVHVQVGVPYVEYKWLPTILSDFNRFMKEAGQAPPPPGNAFPARGGIGSSSKPVVESVA